MLIKKTAYKTVRIACVLLILLLMPLQVFAQQAVTMIDQTSDLYPIDVEEKEENNYGVIIRTYALKPGESPSDIPMNSFSKYGIWYELSEVIKKENRSNEVLEHVETVTIETATNDMNEILKQVSQQITYEKDGYTGVLNLDISSVNCEPAGYTTSSYTKTVTKDYQRLPSQDLSLIPKSVTENGSTYTLTDNISFVPESTNSIDYEEIASLYTAKAVYSRTGSSKNVTGYVTTALYNGEITKVLTDETIYKVYFMSKDPITEPEPEPLPEPTVTIELIEPEISGEKSTSIMLPVVLSVIALGAVVGIIVYLILNSHNTIIYCKESYEYKVVGRAHIDYKAENPTIDLNKLKKLPDGNEFVIEISKASMKKLLSRPEEKRTISIRYRDMVKEHEVAPYTVAEKYQFELSFKGREDDYYEEE